MVCLVWTDPNCCHTHSSVKLVLRLERLRCLEWWKCQTVGNFLWILGCNIRCNDSCDNSNDKSHLSVRSLQCCPLRHLPNLVFLFFYDTVSCGSDRIHYWHIKRFQRQESCQQMECFDDDVRRGYTSADYHGTSVVPTISKLCLARLSDTVAGFPSVLRKRCHQVVH